MGSSRLLWNEHERQAPGCRPGRRALLPARPPARCGSPPSWSCLICSAVRPQNRPSRRAGWGWLCSSVRRMWRPARPGWRVAPAASRSHPPAAPRYSVTPPLPGPEKTCLRGPHAACSATTPARARPAPRAPGYAAPANCASARPPGLERACARWAAVRRVWAWAPCASRHSGARGSDAAFQCSERCRKAGHGGSEGIAPGRRLAAAVAAGAAGAASAQDSRTHAPHPLTVGCSPAAPSSCSPGRGSC